MSRLVVAVALAVVCLATLVVASEFEAQRAFASYTQQFSKKYETTQEFFKRFEIYKANAQYIASRNAENLGFWLAENQFTDMTNEEFRATLNRPDSGIVHTEVEDEEPNPEPASIDWRDKGAVQKVKDQGQCGSCWAFSATAAIESINFLNGSGTLLDLAEQQLVDCDKSESGCNGGMESDAIEWIAANGGQCAQKDYPYTARDGTCKKTCTPVGTVSKVVRFTGEAKLQTNLINQPCTVAVDAGSSDWQSYAGGVYAGHCGKQLNHAILAVGYTSTYWIVKNSWGSAWGAKGYIFMKRGSNICGVASEPSYPVF
jgi:C1A family cysteine protease